MLFRVNYLEIQFPRNEQSRNRETNQSPITSRLIPIFKTNARQMRTVKVNGAIQVPCGRSTLATYNTVIIIVISNHTLHWTSYGSTGILSTLEDLY
ncbi:uncharacterized protein N7487_010562 [Penicillium crustosum]|uniref:uncharacterized protein n=1 Tax=Penicillium crustosum TaxID=36656 RepID=UPI002391C0C0|nr:uncharacterized protein N7487_010562 [Penicillium crustosum]KAJ5396259.1 hypothetical protein N7487_010562 [Penicillium crustosum]